MLRTNKVRSSGLCELFSVRTLCSFTYSLCCETLSELNCKERTAERRSQHNTRYSICNHHTDKLCPRISDSIKIIPNVLLINTCKSSRNNTRLVTSMFLLGRRHLGMNFHTGSANTKVKAWRFFLDHNLVINKNTSQINVSVAYICCWLSF